MPERAPGWCNAITPLALAALAGGADGFTIDARTGRLVHPDEGFAVGLRGTTARFPSPTVEGTAGYLRRHRKKLLAEAPPLLYFGGWRNRGGWCEYDVARIVCDEDEAVAVAVAQGQSAVYDFRRRRSLTVPGQGHRRVA